MSDICTNTGRLCSRCQPGSCSFRREAKIKIKQLLDHCNTVCEKEVLRGGVCGSRYMEHDSVRVYLEELQRYKDLEEAGRLITLPCKVDDTVYYIDIDQGKVEHSTVNWISIGRRLSWLRLKNKKNIVFCDKLGGGSDVFFLTEEEAYAEMSRIFQAMQDELEAEAEWVAMEGGAE